jgi:hypothetical protein
MDFVPNVPLKLEDVTSVQDLAVLARSMQGCGRTMQRSDCD